MSNCPVTGLPLGKSKPALDVPHFPVPFQAVIWRNWGLVTPERLASVLGTSGPNMDRSARDLGLGTAADGARERLWRKRGYVTLIRQNWHLLDYPQLLDLLGWTSGQMAFALKEDDFLWSKLGGMKPFLPEPIRWTALTSEQVEATRRLRERIRHVEGDLPCRSEELFGFLDRYGRAVVPAPVPTSASAFGLKLAYSHSAIYGDPLLDPELDPYPDGLLADLAANGVNAVWLQGVLYSLVPWFGESARSAGCDQRIANLNALAAKAGRHGIGLYLYLNEPRGMPPGFFENRPSWKGSHYAPTEQHAICLTGSDVLAKLREGVAELFRKVPALAGVFTITMSENLTHCGSKGADLLGACPRCRSRSAAELVAEVNNAIAAGAHAAKPEAVVVAWDWGWDQAWDRDVVDRLRPDLKLMCTSESYLRTNAQGIEGMVGDYTMSKIGPGPKARRLWAHAADRGLELLAKVQMNNTWECSAVPYLPVPFLVRDHLRNLKEQQVSGLMVSWTLGGYPGGNLRLAEMEPETLAMALFGEAAADGILAAWRRFGEAFAAFPLHGCSCLYCGPQNYGPMNHLFPVPTGRTPTMLGFPYDGLDTWRGVLFPPEIFEEQFRRLSEGWSEGLARLESVAGEIPADKQENFEDLANVAEAADCHFRSTYLQIRFIRLRDGERQADTIRRMHAVLDEEIVLAQRLLTVLRRDSRIGFEASNHYYYTEQTLLEKILNCEQVRSAFPPLVSEQATTARGGSASKPNPGTHP